MQPGYISSQRAAGESPRRPRQRVARAAHVGACGVVRSGIRASAGVRSPLRWLQPPQAATVFSQVFFQGQGGNDNFFRDTTAIPAAAAFPTYPGFVVAVIDRDRHADGDRSSAHGPVAWMRIPVGIAVVAVASLA